MKGLLFVNRRYTKGVPIFAKKKKNGILKVKRLDLETEPPRVNIC